MSKVYIIYDTRTGKTEKMAHAIAEGARSIAGVEVVLKKVDNFEPSEVLSLDGVILGSPTHNTKPSYGMKNFMDKMKQYSFKGKVGSAFGSYGWSGEAVPQMIAFLKELGMNVIEPGLRCVGVIDEAKLDKCREFGRDIGRRIIEKVKKGKER
ncbi:MAG: flavodoxin domain-containing protein [Halobacteria archaeon]